MKTKAMKEITTSLTKIYSRKYKAMNKDSVSPILKKKEILSSVEPKKKRIKSLFLNRFKPHKTQRNDKIFKTGKIEKKVRLINQALDLKRNNLFNEKVEKRDIINADKYCKMVEKKENEMDSISEMMLDQIFGI